MVNLVVLEPTGTMSADVDNIRFEINPELAPQDKSGWVLSLPKDKKYVSAAIFPIPVLSQFDTSREVPTPLSPTPLQIGKSIIKKVK